MKVLSLGAGVQSSTMALMAAVGELETPDCAIFADTGDEPVGVYRWLDELESYLSFPVYRVQRFEGKKLSEVATSPRTSKSGKRYIYGTIPAYVLKDGGEGMGMLPRHCTGIFKIQAIQRYIKKLANGDKGPHEIWIGISVDEIIRMKPSQLKSLINRWPLVERRMSRDDCLEWMSSRGYPRPPRSACVYCPYRPLRDFVDMKTEDPESFERAAVIEESYDQAWRSATAFNNADQVFMTKALKPLRSLTKQDLVGRDGQMELFAEECEGMCGV